MKKFRFNVEVSAVDGSQTFEVEASSAEEAHAKLLSTGGEIVDEELSVQGLAWHTAVLIEEKPS